MIEEIEGDAADSPDFFFLPFLLLERPRRALLNEFVRSIRQSHHDPSHLVGVARLIGLDDLGASRRSPFEKPAVVGVGVAELLPLHEARRSAREVDQFAHEFGVDFGGEFLEVEIDVAHPGADLARVVVAEIVRGQVVEVGPGQDVRPPTLGHLFAVDGEKTVHVDPVGKLESRGLQHGGPEKGVKVDNVLADEVVDLAVGISPPVIEDFFVLGAPIRSRRDIAHGRIHPDVEEMPRGVGNLKAEIGRRAADIPISQRLGEKGALELFRDLGL